MWPEMETRRVPGALLRAEGLEGLGAVVDDARDVRERLHVVHHRGALVEAAHREARRAVARIAALAFERGEQARRLAAHVGAGAAVDDEVAREVRAEERLSEVAGGVRLLERARDAPVRQVELAADVDERVPHLQRVGGDQHRLEEQVRRALEDPAVLEGARLALVGVGAEVVRLAVVEVDHAPLAPGGEVGAAASPGCPRR
jgi:hypothetical protein